MERWIFVLWAFLSTGIAIASDCPVSDNESVLHPQREYWYRFKSEAVGESVGTTNDRSRMIVECSVHIVHAHDCFYQLKLKGCVLSAAGGPLNSETAWINAKEIPELSRFPVMFTLGNGEIKHVYADEKDPLFYVNIKRGALSAFVFKLSSTKSVINELHVDVHGTCPWHSYPSSANDGNVKAHKDMNNCVFPSRPDWQLSPWSLFWNMSFIQYQINSTFNCEYKVDMTSQTLEKLFCKESHGLESIHRTTTAVQTNVYYHMILEKYVQMKSAEKFSKKSLPTRRTNILFEYGQTPDPKKISSPPNFLSQAEKILSDLVETSKEEIHLLTIPKFTNFVAWLRTAHDLIPFVERVKDCLFLKNHLTCTDNNIKELAMSYLSDALVQCNTVPCIQAVSDLAISNHLSDHYLNFVLYSWNNMHFTKSAIISHVKKICEAKDSRYCWLVLGTIVQNYRELNLYNEIPKELEDVASHFYNSIKPYCNENSGLQTAEIDEDHYYQLITNLKAIGNIGAIYLKYVPDGIQQLLRCGVKETLPMHIRIASIEALQNLNVCQNPSTCDIMHRILKPMFTNSSVDVGLRIAIYQHLILTPDTGNLENDLIHLLQVKKNTQMLSYMASDLSNRLSDAEFTRDHKRFCHALTSLLKSHEISLYALQSHRDEKSKNAAYGSFFKIPFLPEEIQGFGLKYELSSIFPFYNMIPQSLKTNVSLQLFSKVINFIQTSGNIKGLYALQPLFEEIGKQIHGKPFSLELFTHILTAIENFITSEKTGAISHVHYPFDKHIVDNIQKIHNLFQQHQNASKLSFNLFFGMFGSTLNMFTSGDLRSFKSMKDQIPSLLDKLKQGVTYNQTRVIRIIEAYHQVPTIMGLPLNWTTSATLAFSSRKGLKLAFEKRSSYLDLHGNGFFQPSVALTFLNRMVLDFPTITQIGVQANSSGFTSTQWKAHIDYSATNNQRLFVIEAPQKTQNLLELYQINQLIKHNYDDIPDWDIQRTSASWCSSKQFSSVLGLEVCLERSYPNVTNSIEPRALIAGSCKWTLQARLYDKNLKSYNFNLKKTENDLQRETKLIFDAPGSTYKRGATLKLTRSLNSEDVTVSIKIEELPEFSLFLSNIRLFGDEGKVKGHQTLFEVNFADNLKYNLVYNRENNILKITEGTTDKNKSPKPKKLFTLAQETALTLETPYNIYKYNRKMHFQDKNIKADISASYENHHSEWNWLPQFLPPTLWDTHKKAWLRLRFNLRGPSPRTIICSIDVPQSSLQLASDYLPMPGKDRLYVNLTKMDASNKLLSFANFTYHLWTSASDTSHVKQVEILNFTIPQQSWSLRTKSIIEDSKLLYDVVFARAQMKPKSDIDENEYVGWWSDEMNERFDLLLQEFKFKADIDSKLVESSEILRKVPTLREEDIFNLINRYILANVVFIYPSKYQEESINFDGSFIISHSESVFRFQKNFALLSSYNNLRLNSHSVYRSEGDNKLLSHNSYFTHTSSETKAFYNLNYKEIHHETDCYDIDFDHNISSHVLDFTSNFNHHCDVSDPERKTFILNLDSSSKIWDKLNARLRQKIDGTENESFETVNFTHPLLNIDVTADWHGNRHTKTAIFTKTSDKMPVLILNLKSTIPWTTELVLEMPTQHDNGSKIIYERKIIDNFRWFQIDVHFPNERHEALKLEGQILDPHKRIWIAEIFPKTSELWSFFKGIERKMYAVADFTARDPDHPLNQILKPALKMPLAQYLSAMKREIQINTYYGWNSIKSVLEILKPIYETPVYIMTRLSSAGLSQMKQIYSATKEKSITTWAINYFKLPELFPQGLMNMSQGFHMLKNMLLPPNEGRKFVYYGSPSLYWKSYKQLPVPASFSPHHNRQYPRSHNYHFSESKVGMIFGPRHVYTFDGLLYEFSNYPSEDCVYLLAHDIHRSTFSILATFNAMHLLFPEVAVTINSEGYVYINGSKTEQSLPFQSINRNVFIKREGKILKVSSPAITVLCDTSNELCTLKLNAWNGGGTIGLLGNADGELYNEYMIPDGSIANNVIEFGAPYELSGNSQCQHLKVPERPAYVPEHGVYCRQGLRVVCDSYENSKKYFFSSCLTNLKDCNNGCPSIAALAALCYFDDELMITKCNVPQQESKNIRHKLEVILLVNEHVSMMGDSKGMLTKGLESAITAIDRQFQSNGYANILYSVLGFGGAGVHFHPSVHTIGKNIWVSHKTAVDLLKTLDFKGTVNIDPVAALRYAMEVLGQDTFDSKVVIVFTNEDKQETTKQILHLVQSYLEKNSITLYVLAFYPTIEKGKKVFGVRADGLVFPSPSKEAEAYLDYPNGDLAKLVSITKGSLFLKHFVQQNGPPNFFTELAQEIWTKVRKEVNFCRSCKSIRSGWWYYYNQCVLTNCNIGQ